MMVFRVISFLRRLALPCIFAVVLATHSVPASHTLEGPIRDVEIEEALKMYLEPLARVAGFEAPLRPYVVASFEVNASATLNATIFVHTGLILHAPSLEALLGVLAHELGHLKCGHLARRTEALRQTYYGTAAGILAGALAGVLSGRGDVGASLALGGMQMAHNKFLLYSQSEESGADQAAIEYMTRLKWPLKGLEDFLKILQSKARHYEQASQGQLNTHPPTSERVEHIRHAALKQRDAVPLPEEFQKRYRRMVAKLRGFMNAPESVIQSTQNASSFEDQYARSIALFRAGKMKESMKLLDHLLVQEPQNPFLHELKGQFLLEEGRVNQAMAFYQKAVQLHPSALLKIEYAHALLASEREDMLSQVQKMLEEAQPLEKNLPFLWQGLSIVYGKQGKMSLCQIALAEKALLMGDVKTARSCAEKAQKLARPHSREALRAQDILHTVQKAPSNPQRQ